MANDLDRLLAIVDLLGPNMWLELDRKSFPWFFEFELDSTERERRDGLRAARAFAKQNRVVFHFIKKGMKARFGRAYFKTDEILEVHGI